MKIEDLMRVHRRMEEALWKMKHLKATADAVSVEIRRFAYLLDADAKLALAADLIRYARKDIAPFAPTQDKIRPSSAPTVCDELVAVRPKEGL